MNKETFITQLRTELSGFPQEEIEERLTFYREMIEDKMEDGWPEEAAVAQMDSVEEIVSQIKAERPQANNGKDKKNAWGIALWILGAPVWLALLIAALAVCISLYAALWAVFAAFVAGGMGGLAGGIVTVVQGNGLAGAALIGAGIVCAGLSIFAFFGGKAATKGILRLIKKKEAEK